jgi:biotin carboxyl carrier protein
MNFVPRLGRHLALGSRSLRAAAIGALLIYVVIMLWPYLAATLVRDAAVTAWTNLATAPIRGRVQSKLPLVGTTVRESGIVFELVNEQHDSGEVLRAEAQLAATRARVTAAVDYLEGVREIDNDRRDLRRLYAAHLRRELDVEIAAREARIVVLEVKGMVAAALAERTKNVSDSGYRSRDYHDDALLRVAEVKAELAAERMAFDQAKLRRAAIDEGVFYSSDGSGPNWAYEQQQQAKTEIKRAQNLLQAAQLAEQEAERLLDATKETFRLQSRAAVTAPGGATIQSIIVGAGATVQAGDPLATWINCDDLYVDAPVSDAALALISIGSEAELIIEGEGKWRQARVAVIRGAAATIGAADLAAVAKGRHGDGQVLLKLESGYKDFGSCPVGRAAYVHFPTAGIFAVVLARLGLK